MKRFNLTKLVGISALALSLATLPAMLPTSAQTTDTGSVDSTPDGTFDGNYGDGDWGLLGLLGLFGLLGRRSAKQNLDDTYSSSDVVSPSSTRSRY